MFKLYALYGYIKFAWYVKVGFLDFKTKKSLEKVDWKDLRREHEYIDIIANSKCT